MSKVLSTITLVGLVAVGLPACATKKFVRQGVGEVNKKVDALGQSVEETQERTKRNEGAISDVDKKAQAAQGSADQARQAANAAGNDARLAGARANEVGVKTDALDKASKRLVYEVVISEDEGQFKFGKTDLPDEAKSEIDQLIAKLTQDPKNVFIEIEGHTDNVGGYELNMKLSQRRAESVVDYLVKHFGIERSRLTAKGYGYTRRIAYNNTPEGRQKNRRIDAIIDCVIKQ